MGYYSDEDAEYRDFGARIYYEKAVTAWGGSGHFGFRYMIGAIIGGGMYDGMVGPANLTGGLGINYMFF